MCVSFFFFFFVWHLIRSDDSYVRTYLRTSEGQSSIIYSTVAVFAAACVCIHLRKHYYQGLFLPFVYRGHNPLSIGNTLVIKIDRIAELKSGYRPTKSAWVVFALAMRHTFADVDEYGSSKSAQIFG